MKRLCILIFAVIMLAGCRTQSYIDACHMSDLIRAYKDALSLDSTIIDGGLFDKLCKLNLQDSTVCKHPVQLDKYVWGY